MQATIITGQRHVRTDRECFCGCKAVIDCTGYIVQDSDTPKLATLDLLIAEFPDVPFHSGPVQIAYSYSELGLTRPAPEPAHHETVRLFEPAPTQIPGSSRSSPAASAARIARRWRKGGIGRTLAVDEAR